MMETIKWILALLTALVIANLIGSLSNPVDGSF